MEAKRRVGVAIDFSGCSNRALRWAVDNVGRNGDHLIHIFIKPQGFYEDGGRCSFGKPRVLVCPHPLSFIHKHIYISIFQWKCVYAWVIRTKGCCKQNQHNDNVDSIGYTWRGEIVYECLSKFECSKIQTFTFLCILKILDTNEMTLLLIKLTSVIIQV